MVAGVELSLFMGLLGCGIIVLRGPASIGHIKNFGCRSKIFFLYILYIGWGSVGGWWVMTAGVMISLFMGCIHAGIIDSGGLTHIGDIPPVGRGLTPKKNFFFLYIFSI